MLINRFVLLLPLVLAACNSPTPTFQSSGTLAPGSRMTVRTANGAVSAYAPTVGQPKDRYTVSGFGKAGSSNGLIEKRGRDLTLCQAAPPPAAGCLQGDPAPIAPLPFLVRVPDRVFLDVRTLHGAINVSDITGNVNARSNDGNVKIMIEGYANASAGNGNVSVTFGSTSWPGTLHFSADNGDVEIYVNAKAAARVHLHTDRGTIFTDFELRGTSRGNSETIDGEIAGGAERAIDVEVRTGSIRMLQLKPQV